MIIGAPWLREPEVAASSVVASAFDAVPVPSQWLGVAGPALWRGALCGRLHALGARAARRRVRGNGTAPRAGTITPGQAHAAYGLLDSEPDRYLTFVFDWEAT